MATAAKAKQTTVSTKQLAATLAESHEMPKKQAEAILGDLVTLLTKHLKKGDRIRLVGLGVLVVRKRAAELLSRGTIYANLAVKRGGPGRSPPPPGGPDPAAGDEILPDPS